MADQVQMRTTKWKLGGKFASFTGLLNGTYLVKDGVTSYAEGRVPSVLITHYGAKPVENSPAVPVKTATRATAAAEAAE